MSPIGVGFIELDSTGQFHLQRLGLRPEFHCHGVTTLGSKSADPLDPLSLLDSPEISLVCIGAGASLSWIQRVLESGKHVLCGLPINGATDDWRRAFEASITTRGPQVFIGALHRWDRPLLTVQSVMRDGSLGTVVDLRRISRQYVPAELSFALQSPDLLADSSAAATRICDADERLFHSQWFRMLDELLQLVPERVINTGAIPTVSGRSAWVKFASGCQAHVELNRRSLSPLETGWIVEGTAGGYAAGRRFRAGSDYELVDVPVDELPTDQDGFYNSLVAAIRDREPFPVTSESILRVLALRDALESAHRACSATSVIGE